LESLSYKNIFLKGLRKKGRKNFNVNVISPSCMLYPPACKPYGLEAEQEAESKAFTIT
jgi:hypothetical protein